MGIIGKSVVKVTFFVVFNCKLQDFLSKHAGSTVFTLRVHIWEAFVKPRRTLSF
jgi:hypothetical protein